jgi:hypothetical protein
VTLYMAANFIDSLTYSIGADGPSVTLSCIPASTGPTATGFNFYRGTMSGGPYGVLNVSPLPTPMFTDTTVAYSTTYYYVATALDTFGESPYSAESAITIPAAIIPNSPTALVVGRVAYIKVPLYWTAPAPQPGVTVISYNVYGCVASGCVFPSLIVTGLTFTSCVVKCTQPDQKCFYQVRANVTVDGQAMVSGPSNVVRAQVY